MIASKQPWGSANDPDARDVLPSPRARRVLVRAARRGQLRRRGLGGSGSGTPELELAFDVWLDRVVKLRFPWIDFGQLRGRENRTMLSESI